MPAKPDLDVVAALRQATSALHSQVEREMPLIVSAPTLESYAAHLAVSLRWLRNIAEQFGSFSDGPQDPELLPSIDRLGSLEADLLDLRAFGVQLPSFPAGESGTVGELSLPFRWGVIYVVEGSQLGGIVLEKQLSACLPATQLPRRYLGGSGVDVRVRWRRFLRTLREDVRGPQDIEFACHGAVWTFDSIRMMASEYEAWNAARNP